MSGALLHTLCVQRCLTTTVTAFGVFRTDLPGCHFLSLQLSAVFILHGSVSLWGFILYCRLFLIQNLICDFCSSDQSFARGQSVPTSGYLQICSRLQHPCLRLSPSRYRADSELSPVKMCAAGHTKKTADRINPSAVFFGYSIFSKLSVCCRVCHGHADRLFWALWVQAYIPGSSPPPRSAHRGETGLIFPDHQSAKP